MTNPTVQHALSVANQQMQAGQLVEAARTCKKILTAFPNDAEALNTLGLAQSRLQEHVEAINNLRRAVSLQPKNHVYLTNLGAVFAASKDLPNAIDSFRLAIAAKSGVAQVHYNLANALKESGRYEEAVASYRKAIQINPSYAAAWNNLGAAYTELLRLDEALVAVKRSLTLNPSNPLALNNIANVFLQRGDLKACVEQCLAALDLRPDYLDALRTLGQAYTALGENARAILCYREVAELAPDRLLGLIELARTQLLIGEQVGLLETLQSILAIDANHEEALKLTALFQLERGHYPEAEAGFSRLLSLSPSFAFRVRRALALPPIVSSASEITKLRETLNARIDELLLEDKVIHDPYLEQVGVNFYLAYHGLNNRDIQRKIGRLYRKACPSLTFIAPHCQLPAQKRHKLKVGFFSKFIYQHSVSASFAKVITSISQRDDFEIYLISTSDHTGDSIKELYSGFKGMFAFVTPDLRVAHENLARLELDVLIYLDIGMDPFSFLLAFARLAPVQCVSGGHPDTTGIDTLDYYLSAEQAESEDADEHYSEKLVRLPSGGFSFSRPELPALFKTRAALGLPESGNIYLCPMMLQKLHPDFDRAIAQILQQDPTGYVVLSEHFSYPQWGALVRERLKAVVNAADYERIVFIPWVNDRADLLSLISLSAVVLDPFHFGIGTTAALTCAVGTPVVTLPGKFLRGRVGLFFSKLLDVSDCIASSTEDYVVKAVQIANDPGLRHSIQQRILKNSSAIFDRQDYAADDYAAFVRRVASVTVDQTQGVSAARQST